MVSRQNDKRSWSKMNPLIEVKMLVQTDKGDCKMNFFTIIEPCIHHYLDEEEFLIGSVSEVIQNMMDKVKGTVNGGWAMVSYKGDELFMLSFINEQEINDWQIHEENNLTIH